uniref:Uncharacterized protein n=1 Tax=Arundo donax TaxID=35708 RepID=A0A0A9AXA6_ARUDO
MLVSCRNALNYDKLVK